MFTISDRLHNMRVVNELIKSTIDEQSSHGKINKETAESIRADLRMHVLQNAQHLSEAFQRCQGEDLCALKYEGKELKRELRHMQSRLKSLCERSEDKLAIVARIDGIILLVKGMLKEISTKIDANAAAITHGRAVMDGVGATPARTGFFLLHSSQLPAWGKRS